MFPAQGKTGDPWADAVSSVYAAKVDPAWEALKDRGNAALKAGDREAAIKLYTDAFAVARGRDEQIPQLRRCLRAHPEGSPARRIGDESNILGLIGLCLPDVGGPVGDACALIGAPEAMKAARTPNKPAAVCLANRSLVHFQDGQYDLSLFDAQEAAALCPEYVKAHHRIAKAHAAMCRGLKGAADQQAR